MTKKKEINFKPLNDYLLCEKIQYGTKKSTLIIEPESVYIEKILKVVAVSETRKINGQIVPLDTKIGDVVLATKASGVTVNVDGQEYLMIHESDILGFYEE